MKDTGTENFRSSLYLQGYSSCEI